jgi:RNA polymerase sigma-70 factor (ECF subfamily)
VLPEVDARGFRDGDPEAVRGVYRAYGRLVFAVALKVLGDRGLAEEATQQAFVQAWKAARTFDPSREMGPWLATIARRTAIDVHRREARRAHDPIEDVTAHPSLITLPESAEAAYDVWEVRRAIDELPEEERQIVRLQHLDGWSQGEIAAHLRVPLGTVKSRSFRAHRHLAARLGHLRETPP